MNIIISGKLNLDCWDYVFAKTNDDKKERDIRRASNMRQTKPVVFILIDLKNKTMKRVSSGHRKDHI